MRIASSPASSTVEAGILPEKRSRLRRYSWPLVGYLAFTLVFSWPLVLNIGNAAVRVRSGDVWQNVWNIWWVQHALFDLHTNPFRTSLVYYPDNPSLYLHALYPLAGLISAPLQWLFGVIVAFNLMAIAVITLSGFCAYLLGRYLQLSPGAAFLAGTVFAYSPIISSQLDQGQLEQISPLWIPLYILFFLKVLRMPNFGRAYWLNCAEAALFFLLTALTTWYYALDLILFSAFTTIWVLVAALWKTPGLNARVVRATFTVRRLVGLALLCLIFSAPLLYPTLREANTTTYAVARDSSVRYNSADIVHFFRPGNAALWFSQAEPQYEFQWFLGFIPLALALFAAFTDWKRSRLWLGVALFFIVLALGPVLKTGLEDYTSIENLPMSWLQKLPLGSIVRVPIRFVTPAMLALGIAAGFGLDRLIGWLSRVGREDSASTEIAGRSTRPIPGRSAIRWATAPVIIGLVFLEFYPGPRTMIDLKLPNFLGQIKNGPTGSVLEMPLLKVQPIAMFDQTGHSKPILGGYLARKPKNDFLERIPLVQLEDNRNNQEFASNDLQTLGLPTLNWYDVRYIVLHTEREWVTEKEEARARAVIAQVLGKDARPAAKDGPLELYFVPPYTGPLANAWGVAGDDWYDLEGNQDTGYNRWSAGESTLYLFNPNKTPQKYKLDLTLYTYAENRTLDFWLNGQLVAQKAETPVLKPESIEITLPSGLSTLGLKATGQAIRPVDRNQGSDKRSLSFGVKALKLTPS